MKLGTSDSRRRDAMLARFVHIAFNQRLSPRALLHRGNCGCLDSVHEVSTPQVGGPQSLQFARADVLDQTAGHPLTAFEDDELVQRLPGLALLC